ncbi:MULTISPECIES: hypothetical protein [Streptomyces]|uniref:Basic proline-rich protein n=1 Tax=Streptomyces flavovirens TaxID=52258 RepID=A0ABV8NEA6_9ACTN|nr:hypothetical protein [Streptomyces sp. MBT51]MBK3597048.1 hypothetical protein [Streptomyces sp. MBT51]
MTTSPDTARPVDEFLEKLDAVLAEDVAGADEEHPVPAPAVEPTPVPDAASQSVDELYAAVTAGRRVQPAEPEPKPERVEPEIEIVEPVAEPAEPGPETVPDLTKPPAPELATRWPTPTRIRTVTGRSGRLPDWRTGQTVDLTKPAEPREPEPVSPEPAEPNTAEPKDSKEQDDAEQLTRAQKVCALVKNDHNRASATPGTTTPRDNEKARLHGRRTVFATTAYGMGWTLHLTDAVGHVLNVAADYAIPASGCALTAGVIGLATRSKAGGVIFVSSLGLIGAMALVPPAYFVGGALTLGCLVAYRAARGWLGKHADNWPWKGVVWAAFIPTATTAATTLLHGTN